MNLNVLVQVTQRTMKHCLFIYYRNYYNKKQCENRRSYSVNVMYLNSISIYELELQTTLCLLY